MFGNFCEFIDLVNIQNDNFIQQMSDFSPKALVNSVVADLAEIGNYETVFVFKAK
jgi:hypothetical protein